LCGAKRDGVPDAGYRRMTWRRRRRGGAERTSAPGACAGQCLRVWVLRTRVSGGGVGRRARWSSERKITHLGRNLISTVLERTPVFLSRRRTRGVGSWGLALSVTAFRAAGWHSPRVVAQAKACAPRVLGTRGPVLELAAHRADSSALPSWLPTFVRQKIDFGSDRLAPSTFRTLNPEP
jgi:hypothetical protein